MDLIDQGWNVAHRDRIVAHEGGHYTGREFDEIAVPRIIGHAHPCAVSGRENRPAYPCRDPARRRTAIKSLDSEIY
jgi:hypothetical protein